MSDFVQNNDINVSNLDTDNLPKEPQQMNMCVVGIRSSHPYDTSKFTNNETTFYTEINYFQLTKLIEIIKLKSEGNSNEESKTLDMNLMFLSDFFTNPSVKMIFRFLCSPDCNDGHLFIDTNITQTVYEFVKFVLQRDCIVEFSDHSMGSFFNNWDESIMQMPKPIEILPITHSGPFKMIADKNSLINSVHPTLVQIGNLSSTEQVEITFNNLGGTKVYKIINPDIKQLSNGRQIIQSNRFRSRPLGIFRIEQDDMTEEVLVPVHCEFNYSNGKIVISSTHWCNLDSVETPVDLPTLRRYCTETMGAEATEFFEYSLSSAQDDNEYKRVISATVRQISSGTTQPFKKNKVNPNNSNGVNSTDVNFDD